MKKIFSLLILSLFVLTGNVVAQQGVLRTQGHPREDLTVGENAFKPFSISAPNYDTDFTMEDIVFWVGDENCENRAALVIDWYEEGKGITLVWGYRWNGDAYGIDMLKAIAAADSRLYLLLYQGTQYGTAIGGIGYDLGTSHEKCLINGDTQYCAGNDGIIDTRSYNFDSYRAVDPNDNWQSGWYNGYWSYHTKDSYAQNFEYSQLGASSRKLVNNSWDGWGYQIGWESWVGMLPRIPYAPAPR